MPALSTWNLAPTKLLTRRELATVLDDLARRAGHSANSYRDRPPGLLLRPTRFGNGRIAAR